VKVCPVCATEFPDDVRFCKNDGSALRSLTPVADLVGQIIAERYHILKKLGEGGMGQVYLAEHVKMGRRSAIKVVNPAMMHDPDTIARFNREASNASRIAHPNVCAVYDFGETADGLVYLVMEFVEGEPLGTVLEREGALPLERAAAIFFQVAEALQAAHELGIVHRDLKPDNVMIARGRGGAPLVKVVDFGIAKAVEGPDGADRQKVTKTGLVIGTPEFMSPEQLAGDPLDGKSDLYALGLVFFRMLTGQLPFVAETVQETMVKRLTDDPLTLAMTRPDLRFPATLQTCFDSALARNPVDRYPSVARFAAGVSQVLGAGGIQAAAPRTRPDVDAQTQLLESSGTVIPGQRATPPTRPSPSRASGEASRRRVAKPVVIGLVALLGAGGAAAAMLRWSGAEPPLQTADTAAPAAPAAPAPNPAADSVARRTPESSRIQPRQPVRASGQSTARTGLDPRMVDDLLVRLIETPARTAVDSAVLVYNTPGVQMRDRAFAACLAAQKYRDLGDRRAALAWADSGLALDNALSSCRNVVRELQPVGVRGEGGSR
jgi:serine/threonine-protein kinase